MVGNVREYGKDRGQQLDETSVVELNLVEAGPLSKYMAGPGAQRVAGPGTNGKGKMKIQAPDCMAEIGTNKTSLSAVSTSSIDPKCRDS